MALSVTPSRAYPRACIIARNLHRNGTWPWAHACGSASRPLRAAEVSSAERQHLPELVLRTLRPITSGGPRHAGPTGTSACGSRP